MGHHSLSQDELLQVFEPQTELNSIIRHYEAEFESKGEVICGIKINNLTLSEEDEQRFKETPLYDIHSLEVVTEDPFQLFKDVLAYWNSNLPRLINSADQLSQSLRFKSLDQSAADLSHFIDESHLLVNSLNSISSLCQHRSISLPARWAPSETKLWLAFNELLDSFNDKNTNIMADTIEYDLADALQTWLEVLSEFHP